MEYLDILDNNGNLTGQKKERGQIHTDGDWHRAVHVWIINHNGDFLLQKRSPNKDSYPNKWDVSFAGHVNAGSTSLETVIKEGIEELGIDLSHDEIKLLMTIKQQTVTNNNTFINNQFDDIYLLVKDIDISKLKLQKEEVSEVRWFSRNEMKEVINKKSSEFVPHYEELNVLLRQL